MAVVAGREPPQIVLKRVLSKLEYLIDEGVNLTIQRTINNIDVMVIT
jgi:hypothetical protein